MHAKLDDAAAIQALASVFPTGPRVLGAEIFLLGGEPAFAALEGPIVGYLRTLAPPGADLESDETFAQIASRPPDPAAVAALERDLTLHRDRVREQAGLGRRLLVRVLRPFLPWIMRRLLAELAKRSASAPAEERDRLRG